MESMGYRQGHLEDEGPVNEDEGLYTGTTAYQSQYLTRFRLRIGFSEYRDPKALLVAKTWA
jgi:hypothetical protein